MLFRPAFGFVGIGATFVCAQTGEAGYLSQALGPQGALAGDFAFWLNGVPPGPYDAWTYLSGQNTAIYARRLTAGDLTATAKQQGSLKWGAVVYRDVTAAQARMASGFAKSPAHVGVIGISTSGRAGSAAQVTSPTGATMRFVNGGQSYLGAFDLVGQGNPYPDGAAWTPDTNTWDVIELLRS